MEIKKQTNLSTSGLVNAIREAVHPCGSLTRGDAFINLESILRSVEGIEGCTDLEDEYKKGDWWMGVRKNGSELFGGDGRIAEWSEHYADQAVAIYHISYDGTTRTYGWECIKVWERDEI